MLKIKEERGFDGKEKILRDPNSLQANILRIIKGSVIAIIISVIFLAIFAILLTYTSISESTIIPTVIVITCISILAGSYLSTIKIKQNGILNGAIVGLIYVLFLYIFSSAVFMDFSLSINSFIMIGAGILTGMLGGIIGVNMKN
jgi:putative membrane protein (TIGR04086 family)